MSDKKELAALIVGMKPKKDAPEMDESSEGNEMDEGKMQAAQEILEALESKDASQLLMALENLIEMCK